MPGDDTATVTARQLRDLLQRLIAAGQWQTGDPDILAIFAKVVCSRGCPSATIAR